LLKSKDRARGQKDTSMIQNRELTMDDYLAMLRRRAKVILFPALLAPLVGFLVSYAFTAKYSSQSTILVEGQKVPNSMVQPVATEDLAARINTLIPQVTSQAAVKPMLQKIYGAEKSEQSIDQVIDDINTGQNFTVEPVTAQLPNEGQRPANQEPAFKLTYTASTPREAQAICGGLASLVLEKNLTYMQDRATGTTNVLSKGIADAKHNLDELDRKLADFKEQYVGQLPGDEENNLKILTGLSSQLDADTQRLNVAQQDKAYTESVLAQQLATWKSSQSSTNPDTLQKQLSDLQSQLLSLQARYTGDHPDVIKTKADIAEVKKKLAEINNASSDAPDTASSKASAMEPAEIRQLRMQIHQNEDEIAAYSREEKKIQQQIAVYQGRVSLSPAVEEQYKGLTRDYENAQKNYQDLLANKNKADLTVNMTNQSQGEQMIILNPANLPDSPSFPNRWMFAGGGLAAGLALGIGLALWLELRDQSIRTEADAEAALELPLLAVVPWVGPVAAENGNHKLKFWSRKKSPDEQKETVGV
jgi:polysaccharide chain length determinant protein (PEP-CTERM system associated)